MEERPDRFDAVVTDTRMPERRMVGMLLGEPESCSGAANKLHDWRQRGAMDGSTACPEGFCFTSHLLLHSSSQH